MTIRNLRPMTVAADRLVEWPDDIRMKDDARTQRVIDLLLQRVDFRTGPRSIEGLLGALGARGAAHVGREELVAAVQILVGDGRWVAAPKTHWVHYGPAEALKSAGLWRPSRVRVAS